MVVVIDYNVGDIKSVCNAFSHIGCGVKLSRKRKDIENATGVVLLGVATFGYAAKALGSTTRLIKDAALVGKPVLGICVGYQMLFDKSSKYGQHDGLGLIRGNVVAIPQGRRVPHMGWNSVKIPKDMDLLVGLGGQKNFYFAHSYYADITDSDVKIAYTNYGFDLPASVQKANIYGTQFHPEKSSQAGLKVLKNFALICERLTPKC